MHLYLHIPFCARRCSYCDFAIAVRRDTPSRAFTDAILGEWDRWQGEPAWNTSPVVDTIYVGGGTPSRLEPSELVRLLNGLRARRPVTGDAEVTLEANPDDVTRERASAWRAAGVTRVSLGVQTFSPDALAWMHRTHEAPQVPAAVRALRDAGISNVSIDLIYALPDTVPRDWAADLDQALSLEPAHVSLYGLTVEPHTPLGRWTARGEVTPLPDDRAADEYLSANARLAAEGFEHYEVSNAARPGFRSRHNFAYWRRAPFIGLGPSAHSGLGAERSWNVRDWVEYQRRMAAGETVRQEVERLSAEQVALENRYLALRTTQGAGRDLVPEAVAMAWRQAGWALVDAQRTVLTPEGWLRLDALVASLPA